MVILGGRVSTAGYIPRSVLDALHNMHDCTAVRYSVYIYMKSEVIFQIQITEGGLKAKKEFEFKIVVEEVPRNTLFILPGSVFFKFS